MTSTAPARPLERVRDVATTQPGTTRVVAGTTSRGESVAGSRRGSRQAQRDDARGTGAEPNEEGPRCGNRRDGGLIAGVAVAERSATKDGSPKCRRPPDASGTTSTARRATDRAAVRLSGVPVERRARRPATLRRSSRRSLPGGDWIAVVEQVDMRSPTRPCGSRSAVTAARHVVAGSGGARDRGADRQYIRSVQTK
jgi:hypothetical protein